jgi:hypothetical protein
MITNDDNTAINILKTIAGARLQSNSPELTLTPDLRAAFTTAFGDAPPNATTEGELARAALTVLAEDPAFAEPIKIMTSQAGTSTGNQRYFEPSTVALTTAVLLVLQTRVRFKRDKDGKWSLDIDKKSGSDSAIKLLVQRLLSFIGK